MQRRLQARIPQLLALAITSVATVLVCLAFAALAVWGFGRVGHSIFTDAARYQATYDIAVTWLDDHGVSVPGLWVEHFNVSWVLRTAQQVTGRVNTMEALDTSEAARVHGDGSGMRAG